MALPSCFRLLVQATWRAFSRAWAKTGKRMAARIAIIAITTRSSIRVKPPRRDLSDETIPVLLHVYAARFGRQAVLRDPAELKLAGAAVHRHIGNDPRPAIDVGAAREFDPLGMPIHEHE